MLNNRKLILDTFCEVYDLLEPLADGEFYNFQEHDIIPRAIYLFGREQFNLNAERIKELASNNVIQVIISNPAEGSETLVNYCEFKHNLLDLVLQNKILIISGGEMDSRWSYLLYDGFLSKILDYRENIQEINRSNEIFSKIDKPYKFLFLNGRSRSHRQHLLNTFTNNKLLDKSLWTNLTNKKLLPVKYEVSRYQTHLSTLIDQQLTNFLDTKQHLFNNEWGEIYLNAEPYIDTYFSLVTETIFEYPYSFRTEKTWKPVAMGHPFIIASNYGFYRDFKNLGFRTFSHLINESFDTIENSQDRINRIAAVVQDLCDQDLPSFLAAAEETCKYNQQHLAEMRVKVRKEFPQRFINFINERSRI